MSLGPEISPSRHFQGTEWAQPPKAMHSPRNYTQPLASPVLQRCA